MIADFQHKLKKQLEDTSSVSYKEICDILDAFQIASGQSFAIGKTKVLLNYLKSGNSFAIENFDHTNKSKEVSSIIELVNIYKDIDQFVDLSIDKEFKEYFS
ncbi:hypothetical protein [Alistipes sp. ZOR0009]|jgi:hypothetical protein|uniref:hypothetical protein n=1 Tax=Alistipes sp. ZOR0009 TaxID=1339253 RepID=UPI000647B5AF|nr:hypothetical protein [Alistipes sp. ZOR0009]